jgi:hypothetical protein
MHCSRSSKNGELAEDRIGALDKVNRFYFASISWHHYDSGPQLCHLLQVRRSELGDRNCCTPGYIFSRFANACVNHLTLPCVVLILKLVTKVMGGMRRRLLAGANNPPQADDHSCDAVFTLKLSRGALP